MKRLFLAVLAVTLMWSLSANCIAADNTVTLTDTKGGPGQTVYLTLELQESVKAAAIGVHCQYDSSLLEALPELCTWEIKSTLSAFEKDNKGVWAVENAEDIQGKLCVLAFRIRDNVAFDQTEVTCTVVIKDGAEEKVRTTVSGMIFCQCTHNYGSWESNDNSSHIRICSLCGGKNTQTHNWDNGVKEIQPDGRVLLIKTCTVCKARTATELDSSEQDKSDIGDTNDGHDHGSQFGTQTGHNYDGDTAGDEHSHGDTEKNPMTVWIVLLVTALLIAVAIWFVKKK